MFLRNSIHDIIGSFYNSLYNLSLAVIVLVEMALEDLLIYSQNSDLSHIDSSFDFVGDFA